MTKASVRRNGFNIYRQSQRFVTTSGKGNGKNLQDTGNDTFCFLTW